MVNNKNKYFWLFSLVIYLFMCCVELHFESTVKKRMKINFVAGMRADPPKNCLLFVCCYASILLSKKGDVE